MRPSERWENLAEIIRAIEPNLEAKLHFCRTRPPHPLKRPVTSAIVALYISRLERALAAIRSGASGWREELIKHPESTQELHEIESRILQRKPGNPRRKLTAKDEEVIGNWLVSKQGSSYSEAKQMLQRLRDLQSGKGAPSKRPATLKMLDTRIAYNLSYAVIAGKMCDCGAKTHGEHCSERIRKRIKELESFLVKYNIPIPPMIDKPGEK